jgi:hypothetical protein
LGVDWVGGEWEDEGGVCVKRPDEGKKWETYGKRINSEVFLIITRACQVELRGAVAAVSTVRETKKETKTLSEGRKELSKDYD